MEIFLSFVELVYGCIKMLQLFLTLANHVLGTFQDLPWLDCSNAQREYTPPNPPISSAAT